MAGTVLEIRLIGELAVLRDGKPVVLPQSKKTRALLAYLILNGGPQRREKLCELLWQVPDDPRGSLRWSLSKLRGIVNVEGVERIDADRERVSFNDEGVEIDFVNVQHAVANGLAAWDRKELADLADRFCGALLEGLELTGQPEFETWRLAQQERARQAHCAILKSLVDKLDDDRSERADRLNKLVQLEPYDCTLHCELITALAQSGRMKEAERQKAISATILKDIDGVNLDQLKAASQSKPQPSAARSSAPLHQEIRFCKAGDGAQIAYASVGEGPPLVKTANWLNHLEFDWESPVWRHIFRAFSDSRRLIRYDSRGNGLSDWNTKDFSFDKMVEDLEVVVDAAGVDQFDLISISQGCAVGVEYAVRHPEKVSKLILFGGYARGWNCRGSKIVQQTEALITLMNVGWGQDDPAFRQLFSSLFMPDAPIENHNWFNELQRMTTTPENASRILRACGEVDVLNRLGEVKAPTLVIHSVGDLRVPYNAGRELAGGIPGARFVTLNTRNHLLPETDPEWPRLLREIEAFLSE